MFINHEHGVGGQNPVLAVWRVKDGLSEGGSRWCDSLGAINRSRFGGWFRARVKEAGMKGGGESAEEMRPKERGRSFLCAWFSVVFRPLEGRGGIGWDG